jgi:hypothetical protein
MPQKPEKSRFVNFDQRSFSPEVPITWDEMMADSFSHLTQAQDILEELAKGVIGPASAAVSCLEACHSVAVALVVLAEAARTDRSQENGPMARFRRGW